MTKKLDLTGQTFGILKVLDSKVFYFAFMPHFKPRDTDLIAELYKLPSHTRIAGAHVTFDVEK